MAGGRSPEPQRRGRSASVSSRSISRSRSPSPRPSLSIVVQRLTKNVTAVHLEEIFDAYGKITDVDLPIIKRLGTHRGTAYITFANSAAAAKAVSHMDRGQLDGSIISSQQESLPEQKQKQESGSQPSSEVPVSEGWWRARPAEEISIAFAFALALALAPVVQVRGSQRFLLLPITLPTPRALATFSDTMTSTGEGGSSDSARIGWAFLSQYYSFVNREPSRLHMFYTKRSTLIHSTEGENSTTCYGQQEIHAKIMSLGFEDCKVYISNVDSQSSAEGGIIVQVIGEMSNSGRPWRKFAQTFFLAEQPNGFFVLNDIFRNIKEEGDDDEPTEPQLGAPTAPAVVAPELAAPAAAAPSSSPAVAPPAEIETEADPTPAEAASFPSFHPIDDEATAPVPLPLPLTNGLHHDEPTPSPPPPAPPAAPVSATTTTNGATEAVPAPAPAVQQQQPKEVAPEPVVAPTPTVETPAPAPTPVTVAPEAPAPVTPAPAAVEEPTPAAVVAPAAAAAVEPTPAEPTPAPAPATPKTWASLAASNRTKWGTQAVGVSGVSSAAAPAPAASSSSSSAAAAAPSASSSSATPPKAASAAAPASGPADTPSRTYVPAVREISHPACFVKGVSENITDASLRTVLESRFGALRECDIIRSKACAFIEFERLDSARQAIQASLRQSEGGEGGIWIARGAGEGDMIHIVSKKALGDRPPSSTRGRGAPSFGTGGYARASTPGSTGGYKGGNPTPPGVEDGRGAGRGGPKTRGGRGGSNGATGASTRGGAGTK
ncbi:hypothetical protein RQP46_006579 [Phenoliferia psychrophenolica]